jgi:DNA-binding winged helix-turn-helix (wHTH) protein
MKTTIVRFGEFEFDSTRGALCRGGVVVKLQPQPFRVLQILLDRAPRIVTREEMAEHIWGSEVHVDQEQSINFCVRQVRSALNDSASSPRFIDTLPKQGYRFIAEVIREDAQSAAAATPLEAARADIPADIPFAELRPALEERRAGPTRRNLVLLGGTALLGVGAIWISRVFRGTARERAIHVVLPLPAGTAAADPGHILGSPVIAPDGTAVIVSLSTDDESYLFIRRLDADHLVRMEGTRGGIQSFWSPDSLHVGFFQTPS